MGKNLNRPVLLNYTGEIVTLKKDSKDPSLDGTYKLECMDKGSISFPPLGKATVIKKLVVAPADMFPTIHYEIQGLPSSAPGVFYLVSENVAKCAGRQRNDLLILHNIETKNSNNILKPTEIILECDNLVHLVSDIIHS